MLGLIIYVALLAIITWLALKKPAVALVAILCMFGLEQWGQVYVEFLRNYGAFTNAYILLLVGWCVFLSYKKGAFEFQVNRQRNRIRLLALALLAYAALSLLWTPDNFPISPLWLASLPYLICSLIFAPLLIGKITDLEVAQQYFIWIAGVLLLLLAFVPEWGSRALIIESGAAAGETLHLPLTLAQLASYLLITAMIHIDKSPIKLIWLALIVFASLRVTYLSDSRGPLIFSVLCIVMMAPLVWPKFSFKHVLYVFAAGLLAGLVTLLVLSQIDTLSERWSIERMTHDLIQRFDFVRVVLEAWTSSWTSIIFGLGNSASWSPDLLGFYPHIVPAEVLAEEGIVGLVIFLFFIAYSLLAGWQVRSMMHLPSSVRKTYVANFACTLFAMLLCLKQGSLITSPDLFLFAIIGEKYLFLMSRENKRNGRLAKLKVEILNSQGFRSSGSASILAP